MGSSRDAIEGVRAAGDARARSVKERYEAEKKKIAAAMFVPRFRFKDGVQTGLPTLGLYEGKFSVEKVLAADLVLVRAYGKNADDHDSHLCLKQPGGAPLGRISLDSQLYSVSGRRKVGISGGSCCVLEPFPHSLDELEAAWKKWKRPAAAELDPEREAQRRLNLAKVRLKITSKKEAAQQELQDIVDKFPGTKAADDAGKIIGTP